MSETADHPASTALSRDREDFVVITGMSGAGRSTAANVLEDLGWYVVDNLPPQLLVDIARLGRAGRRDREPTPIAAVVDVRAQQFSADWLVELDGVRREKWRPRVVFLDATDEALVRRFESVRRPHPLQGQGRLLDGIQTERRAVATLRSNADLVIDTSSLNVHQLTRKMSSLFGAGPRESLRLAVMSFGFKYGLPLDADFVFDMRFLPNPFWDPELKSQTGLDGPVADYVLGADGAGDFLDRVTDLMHTVQAGYAAEGRRYATVALGCTGGKHRSVAMAQALASRLASPSVSTFVVHRDLGQE